MMNWKVELSVWATGISNFSIKRNTDDWSIYCFCCWCYCCGRHCFCCSRLNICQFAHNLRFINRFLNGSIQRIQDGCDIPINSWKESICKSERKRRKKNESSTIQNIEMSMSYLWRSPMKSKFRVNNHQYSLRRTERRIRWTMRVQSMWKFWAPKMGT